MQKNITCISIALLSFLLLTACGGGGSSGNNGSPNNNNTTLTAEQALGKKLFFDANLSSEGNQSCSDCHDPASGFADPNVTQSAPVSEGSVSGEFGNRNAPTAAYASFIPDFTEVTTTTDDGTVSNYQGGQFLDGRAVDLVEQAKGPFLNPVEMNNTDEAEVVNKVQNAYYVNEFLDVFGTDAFNNTSTAYNNIAVAIAAFEESAEINPFTSKFDLDRNNFTTAEERGFTLFNGDAKCANCHTSDPDPVSGKVLFTDFNYFNIGTPPNLQNPENIADPSFIDEGLAENPTVISNGDAAIESGKFRTPTLRNISETAPYMHNGRYQTLNDVILHYDNKVTNAGYGGVPADQYPEVDTNIAAELDFTDTDGNSTALGLSNNDISDLEAFLLTLTDGYTP